MLKKLLCLAPSLFLLVGAVAALAVPPGSGPPPNALNLQLNLANYSPSILPKTRVALARVRSQTGSMKLAMIGDSTTAGAGSGSGGTTNMTGARVNSYPMQLKRILQSQGWNVTDENTFGDNDTPGAGTAGITAYDPRLTFAGSSWSRSSVGLAGLMFFNASGTDAMTFAPTTPIDTCDVYYIQASGDATFTVADASGTLATINASGSSAQGKQTITRTAPNTNPISIAKTAGTSASSLFIDGLDCYNSHIPSIRIYNFGAYGQQSGGFVGTASPWSPQNLLTKLASDLTTFDLGINDIRQNTSAATYTANMTALLTTAKGVGDAVIVANHPDNAPVNPSLVPQFIAARSQLSAAFNVPIIDFTALFVSFSASSSEYFDPVHLLATGYADEANLLAQTLAPNGGAGSPLPLPAFTVSSLPSGTPGREAIITDANAACSYGATPTGGGTTTCKVVYLGGWVED